MDSGAALPDRAAVTVFRLSTRHGWALLVALGAAVQLAAFWPGVMVWDSIHQYSEALSGRYHDWHPPAMAWLWRQLGGIAPGPAPMLVLQAALYWTGLALLAGMAAREGRARLALAIAACALLPVPFLLVGTVLKDSLMAGALLLAAGLAGWARPGRRWPATLAAIGAAVLLLAAATLRFNAVPACLPLAAALLPERWRRPWPRFVGVLLGAALALAAAVPVANRLLHARASGVELSLAIYDLGGIAHFSGADVLPPVPVADPSGAVARCWSPVSWDSYSWWVEDHCPVGFERLRPAFAADGEGWMRRWLAAVAAHPLAYARARLAHIACNLRASPCDGRLPGLSLETDPNPFGFRVAPGPLRAAVDAVAVASLATPLGWPVCWLALALACVVVRPWGPGPAAPLAWSALLYGLSYLPLSVASEVRYHFWTMTAAALAAVLTLAARPAAARWRWLLAAALVAAAVVGGVLARL